MRIAVIIAVMIATSLSVRGGVSDAQAHRWVRWHWSEGLAAGRIMESPKVERVLRAFSVDWAECEGKGRWIWSDDGRLKLYKHFDCLIQFTREVNCDEFGFCDFADFEIIRVLHVLGRFDFTLSRV